MCTCYMDWILVVNGEEKPWPVVNYLEEPIIINLNWGIDSSVFETNPLTFNVQDVINGNKVDGVSVDETNHRIVCVIPIVERTKSVKLIFDWSYIRDIIKKDLEVYAGANMIDIGEDMQVNLKGKDLLTPLKIVYKGKDCTYEDKSSHGMNILHVKLSGEIGDSVAENESPAKSPKRVFINIILIIGVIIGSFFIGRIGYKGQNSEIETLVERSKTQEKTISEQSGEISKLKEGIKELEKEKQELITQSYSLLVNGAKWWRDDFEKAGYEDLYDALNKYEFAKVIEYSKDIPAEKGSLWESIIKFCKKHTKENIKGPYSNDGSIAIEKWAKNAEKKLSW